MTTILLTTLVDALGGAVPSDATLTATASLVRTDGETVTAPDNLEVPLTNGDPATPLDLEAPAVGMFWTFLLKFPQRDRPIVRHVTFPDVPTIEWADLTDIDPETAKPDISLLPVWESLRADVQRFSDSAAESVEASNAARDAAVAAQNAAEAVPAQVDTAMADQVGSGGEFDTKLNLTIGEEVEAQAGEKLVYWDDFARPNGPVGSPPSGQTYDLTGAGAPAIHNGALVASAVGSAYAGFATPDGVRRAAVAFQLLTSGGATTPVAIVFGDGASTTDLIGDSAHFIIQRDKWSFQYRSGGSTTTVRDGFFPTPLANGATYLWEVVLDDDGTVSFILDGSILDAFQHDTLTAKLGSATYTFIEPTSQASGGDETQILSAWAFAPEAVPLPAGAKRQRGGALARLFSIITGNTPQMAGFDLVARKGLAQMVRIGRSLTGNLAAVIFNETVDIYAVTTTIRTRASALYVNDGHATNQVMFGGLSGGPGMSARDTNTRLTSPVSKVWATAPDNGLRPGVIPTGSRPSAASMGKGTMIYDETLSKPIWSDGTAWRDAAGTAV